MIDHIYLENDEATYTLVLEDDFGTSFHVVDPQMLHDALAGWREHMAEGEAVRQEYEAACADAGHSVAWDKYVEAQQRTDPEWAEAWREAGDLKRKAARETGPVVLTDRDTGDENDYGNAA